MKFKHAGLFLAPVALVIACGPVQSSAEPAPTVQEKAAPTVQVSTPFTATPNPPTFAPLPTTTNVPSGVPCHLRFENGEPLPDPKCTPGAVLTTNTADVCTPGWAAAHREYFTKKEREAAYARYGIVTANPAGYGEYDHLISLELGGSNSPSNLWPEQGKIPNAKDKIENELHDAVCSGRLSLAKAQHDIAQDWVTAGAEDVR